MRPWSHLVGSSVREEILETAFISTNKLGGGAWAETGRATKTRMMNEGKPPSRIATKQNRPLMRLLYGRSGGSVLAKILSLHDGYKSFCLSGFCLSRSSRQ